MYCQECKNKTCLKTGKPCKELENYLNSKQSDKDLLGIERTYSDRWIRANEIPYDPRHLEELEGKIRVEKEKGKLDI